MYLTVFLPKVVTRIKRDVGKFKKSNDREGTEKNCKATNWYLECLFIQINVYYE